MKHAPQLDSEPAFQMIALFQERAEQLKFPDLDAGTLTAAVEQVERQRDAVEAAAVALDEARQALLLSETALLEQARLAYDYAMIFSRNDEVLQAELAEIKLDGSVKAPKKRRVRPDSIDSRTATKSGNQVKILRDAAAE